MQESLSFSPAPSFSSARGEPEKSTWIREHFANARIYDLLNTGESLRLSREPAILFCEVQELLPGDWVVIDEVQKVPGLLDEVHRLIETRKLNFVLWDGGILG